MDDEILTTQEAAELLRLTPSALAQFRYRGGGPRYSKLGRRVVYRKSECISWLDKCMRERTDRPVAVNVG